MKDKSKKQTKKQAMTLLSIMFMMIVVMIAIIAAMPIITKKIAKPGDEANIHGAFGCYCTTRDCAPGTMVSVRTDIINGESKVTVSTGDSCIFERPEGVETVRMILIGGGGSGAASEAHVEWEELGRDTLRLTQETMDFGLFSKLMHKYDDVKGGSHIKDQTALNDRLKTLLADINVTLYGADAKKHNVVYKSPDVKDDNKYEYKHSYMDEETYNEDVTTTNPETGETTTTTETRKRQVQKEEDKQVTYTTWSYPTAEINGTKGFSKTIPLGSVDDDEKESILTHLVSGTSVTVKLGKVTDTQQTESTTITIDGKSFEAKGGISYLTSSKTFDSDNLMALSHEDEEDSWKAHHTDPKNLAFSYHNYKGNLISEKGQTYENFMEWFNRTVKPDIVIGSISEGGGTYKGLVTGEPQGGKIIYGSGGSTIYTQEFKAIRPVVKYTAMTSPAKAGAIEKVTLDGLSEKTYEIKKENIGFGGQFGATDINKRNGGVTQITIGSLRSAVGGERAKTDPMIYIKYCDETNGENCVYPQNDIDINYLKTLDGLKPAYNFPFALYEEEVDGAKYELDLSTDGQGGSFGTTGGAPNKELYKNFLKSLKAPKIFSTAGTALFGTEKRNISSSGQNAVTPGRGGGSASIAFKGVSANSSIRVYKADTKTGYEVCNTSYVNYNTECKLDGPDKGIIEQFGRIYSSQGGDGAAGAIIFEW